MAIDNKIAFRKCTPPLNNNGCTVLDISGPPKEFMDSAILELMNLEL